MNLQTRTRVVSGAVCLLLLCSSLHAATAAPGVIEFQQPDYSIFPGERGGDEFFNWASTAGLLIGQRGDGWWCYMLLAGGTFPLSGALVGLDPPPPDVATLLDLPLLLATRPAPICIASPPISVPQPASPPVSPTEPLLVLVVGFSNQAPVIPDSTWATQTFGTMGKTIRQYWSQASRGGFTFVPATESQGAPGDGIVRVFLPTMHPDPAGTIDDRNRQITADALSAADPFVNFAGFDLDMSTTLSSNELHILVIVAGDEESVSATLNPGVWGHAWQLDTTVPARLLDGVSVGGDGYAQVGELHASLAATIGVMCHELGHNLGQIDLYDLDLSSEGIGNWGVMGTGGWGFVRGERQGETPVLPCAWTRVQLGFVAPTPVFAPGVYTVREASDPSIPDVLSVSPTAAPTLEYFLIENRQLSGFDAGFDGLFWIYGAPGGYSGGLAIWHIDDAMLNNDTETHKLVDLEEANEGIVGFSQLDLLVNRGTRLHLFYVGHVTSFTDATTPGATLYAGGAANISITSISPAAGTMTFNIAGSGLPGFPTPSCVVQTPAGGATASGAVSVSWDGSDSGGTMIGAIMDYSTDGGATWFPATPDFTSTVANPDPPRPTPYLGLTFIWDSLVDGVGMMGPQPVDFRIRVLNPWNNSTCTRSFFVDNVLKQCTAMCGDCDANGVGPDIVDALRAAQLAVALFPPTRHQQDCCDVDSTGTLTIVDALRIAQIAVGLPVLLACP